MPVITINPATGRRIASHRENSRGEVESALTAAKNAFVRWREVSFAARSRHLRAVASVLRRWEPKLARLATDEMGKPLAESVAELKKCRLVCEFYARHGRAFLADEHPPGAPRNSRVTYQPIGTVLAIMPWNFPYWQAFRAAAPALMAGNTMLLKHAPNVTACAKAIEAVFAEAGVPGGVFRTLVISTDRIEDLIGDPRVAAVTLTGSTRAGKKVASQAGAAMKKGVFELGGSDAYIVLKDADVAAAAETCAAARLMNSGQSCICAKRFIVVRDVVQEFEEEFTVRMAARKVGSPLDPASKVGPLAREDLRSALHRQVKESLGMGARLVMGGRPLPGPGFYYAPTVLADVGPGMPAYDEELFGPVAAIIAVRDEKEAIRVANDSKFGLGSAVFTRSRRAAERVAAQIEAGSVFVNENVQSNPALPFGGVKQSGHGRELGGFGIREFVNVKTLLFA